MKDLWVLYAFFALMLFNILGSLIYSFGLRQLRATVRRPGRNRVPRPDGDFAP